MSQSRIRLRRLLGRLALKGTLAALLTFVLFELALRFLLFGQIGLARQLGEPARVASFYADRWSNRVWVLAHRFTAGEDRAAPQLDERLGWLGTGVMPGTYEHVDTARVGDRRPVLLYGDSFAACVKDAGPCFQDLLEASDAGRSWALVNYAAGGYGLDQAVLLWESSIDLWLELDPVVVIGILVDDDLDRGTLFMREWPKPRFVLDASGELDLESPVDADPERWLAEHPLPATSYAFRYLVYGADVLPRKESEWLLGRTGHVDETRAVNRRILERLRQKLAGLGLEAFVVLFHGERYVHETDWREQFLAAELARLELPWVSSRLRIRADAEATGRPLSAYYLQDGIGRGHYGQLGNRVVFEALASGLEGRFDGPSGF